MRALIRGLALLTLLAFIAMSPAWAGSFIVDDPGDDVDATPGNGTCDDAGGACTLRAAVMEANLDSGSDITFDLAGPIQLTLGDITLLADVIITGPGAENLEIRAGKSAAASACKRVFLIESNITVEISGLTFTDGAITGSCDTADDGGGAILIEGETLVTIDGCVFDGNDAGFDDGGGAIYNNGFLTVNDSVFRNNTAVFSDEGGGAINNNRFLHVTLSQFFDNSGGGCNDGGGAIYNDDEMIIEDSTFDGNDADEANAGGGAVYSSSRSFSVRRSTFSNNHANGGDGAECLPRGGGAFFSESADGLFENCTVSGNFANGVTVGGGGLLHEESDIYLFNCTITDNDTTSVGIDRFAGAGGAAGGGVWIGAGGGDFVYRNTIIVGNRAEYLQGEDCFDDDANSNGTDLLSQGNNLVGLGTGCTKNTAECNTDLVCDGFSRCAGPEVPPQAFCNLDSGTCEATCRLAPPTAIDSPLAIQTTLQLAGEQSCKANSDCPQSPDFCLGEFVCVDSVCEQEDPPCGGDKPVCDEDEETCRGEDKCVDDPTGIFEPLDNNGGPTETHALFEGSIAVDCGDPDGCATLDRDLSPILGVDEVLLETDQRGEDREVDGDLNGSEVCDIGAYELQRCIDTDLDDICDNVDNCVEIPNPYQLDSDDDGIGNVCDEGYFSIVLNDFSAGQLLANEDALAAEGPDGPISTYASFLPGYLRLDALEILGDGDLLFSTINSGFWKGVQMLHNRIYRHDVQTDTVTLYADVGARDLDAIAILADGRIVFSTKTNQWIGSVLVLHANAYVWDPNTGSVSLYFNGRALRLRAVVAIDVLIDGRTVFVIPFNQSIGGQLLRFVNGYAYDEATGTITKVFDGVRLNLHTLDALAVALGRVMVEEAREENADQR